MTLRVVRRPKARQDIVAAALYIAEANPDAARRFLEAVETSIKGLVALPGKGAPRSFRNARLAGLRMIGVPGFESYLVFYRPLENAIEIVRVLHAKRDVAALLGDNR